MAETSPTEKHPSRTDNGAEGERVACRSLMEQPPDAGGGPLKLGVSRCLMGEHVRYDGGHKLDRFLRDTLGQFVEYVPVCPEVECGMSTPRESLRLVGDPDNPEAPPRLLTGKSGKDFTEQMETWARGKLDELEHAGLCGFVFKSKSPSSGLHRIKVYRPDGHILHNDGRGVFARRFVERFPLLPVEDEGRLHDPVLREHFIERIFIYRRLREMLAAEGETRGALVAFHTAHKLLFMAHDQAAAQRLGALVADTTQAPQAQWCAYLHAMAECLEQKASRASHQNVLQHAMGYFKDALTSDEKQELLELIAHYRAGNYPLIVPMTLLNHYVRKYEEPYLAGQFYLQPHPVELALRNHA